MTIVSTPTDIDEIVEYPYILYPRDLPISVDTAEDSNMRIPDDIKKNVVFLAEGHGTQKSLLGTGFFVSIVEQDKVFGYLVTCKHIVEGALQYGRPLFLRANRYDTGVTDFLELDNSQWYTSTMPSLSSLDVAVYPLHDYASNGFQFDVWSVEDLFVSGDDQQTLHEGDEVIFAGLFTPFPGKDRNCPIVRFGHIALLTDEHMLGAMGDENYILVDAHSYQGNSGSPVYVVTTHENRKELRQLGMVANYFDEERLILLANQQFTWTNSGITLVVPVQSIRDMLQFDPILVDRRKTGWNQLPDDYKDKIPILEVSE